MDDINPDLIAPGRLDMILERHESLIKDPATYVIATATRLYENVRKINPAAKAALISNGAECEKFPPDQKTGEKEYLSCSAGFCESRLLRGNGKLGGL